MLRTICGLLLSLALATPAVANEYRAERFDSRIEVLRGGSLRVTETIVFRFEEGTFTKVFRQIPTRRTDGVEFVSATMDGTDFPRGEGPGHVTVKRKNGLRIEWLFAPQRGTTHTFALTYVAHGVVRVDGDADLVAWRALPTEHKYVIDQASVDVTLPADSSGSPTVRARRVGEWQTGSTTGGITISARSVRKNGWLEFNVPMARGSVLDAPPAWQQRRVLYDSYRNPALIVALVILFAATGLIFGMRQSYDSPPQDVTAPTAFSEPPDKLAPALAGALAANGTAKTEHAFAALFALAQRGVLSVEEERGLWGTRAFTLVRRGSTHHLAPHEHAALDTIFRGKNASDEHVTLSKAHSHLTMRFSKFRDSLWDELVEAGLIDQGRNHVRHNYHVVGIALLVLSALALLAVALMFQRFGPWLFLIPGATVVAALGSFIAAGAHTPLSNEGVRRGAAWRAYKKFLRDLPTDGVRRDAWHSGPQSPTTLLPFAVALGLGMLWSKLYKNRSADLPAWFHAASAVDAHRAFVAFVGAGGASAGHAGGGGAGGAGGDASGAG